MRILPLFRLLLRMAASLVFFFNFWHVFYLPTMADIYWLKDRESEWILRTWSAKELRVFKVCPQILQGIQMLELWCDSIWFIIWFIPPSLPHYLHILALPSFLLMTFSLKVIMDFTFRSSSSRSNALLRALVGSVTGIVPIAFVGSCVDVLCFNLG